MKKRIWIFAGSSEQTKEIVMDLSDDYDINISRFYSEVATTHEIRPDVICLYVNIYSNVERSFLRKIRSNPSCKNTPVILLCHNALPLDSRMEAYQDQILEIFDRPFSTEEIKVKLSRIVKREEFLIEKSILQDKIARLSQYFSVDVVDKILSQNEHSKVYGENLEATIFFLDIRNFTTISENVEPNLVAELLNRLYTDIMDLILTYKGSVNKIIGDALLATFGCPVRGDNDASNAVHCALAIRETMKFFNETKPDYIQENISIGMGIATGRVFAGTIGSYRKMDYTVIGDTVNIAARLEGLTKKTRFDLIIDKSTRELLGDKIHTRKLQLNKVRGRTQPMDIFLVDSLKEVPIIETSNTIFFNQKLPSRVPLMESAASAMA